MVKLDTPRLHLRQPIVEDFEAAHALIGSEAMRRYLSRDLSREDSFARHLRNAGCWALFGYGPFSVVERESGAYVGGCGLFRGLRGLGDDFDPYPEAGWVIGEPRWCRGYATEAMTAILAWFDAAHGGRSVCMIAPGNLASQRIADRLGYKPIGLARHKDDEVMRYAREISSR